QTLREVRLPAAMRTSTFPRTRSRHADNDGGRSLGRLSPGHEATNTEMRLRPNNKTRKKPYIPVYMQMQSEREHAAPPQLLYTLIQHISIYMYIYIYICFLLSAPSLVGGLTAYKHIMHSCSQCTYTSASRRHQPQENLL